MPKRNIMKNNGEFKKMISDNSLYFLLGIVLLLIFFNSLFRYFDHDEFEAIHTSWKILNGETIYIDFFQHHHPLLYYVMMPIIKIFGENVFTILFLRIIAYVLFLLILLITYNLAILLFNDKKIGLISLIFLSSSTFFFNKAIEIRPDVPQVLFGLIAIYFFIIQFKKKTSKYTVFSALSLGLSFLFLQKAVFLIFCFLLFQLIRLYKNKIKLKQIFIYWISFILILTPYLFHLLKKDFFANYVLFNWIINMKFTNSFYFFFYGLLESFKMNTILWSFFLIGLIFSRKYIFKEFCLLSLMLLLSLFLIKAPYPQYYMILFPLMAIIAGFGVVKVINKRIAIIAIILAATVLPGFRLCENLKYNTNVNQLEKIKYVLSKTSGNDYVYDGNIIFNIFNKDIDFFWFSFRPKTGGLAAYKTQFEYNYDIYKLIDKYKPKIISNYYIDNMNNETISKNYHPSDKYDDIFIRND